MPHAQPPGAPSLAVSANIRRIRIARGLSARAFVFRLAEFGINLGYTAYTALEKGNTRVTVDLLVAAAMALDVSPATLLMPDVLRGDDPSGLGESTAEQAWSWLRATDYLGPPHYPEDRTDWFELAWPRWSDAPGPGMPEPNTNGDAGASEPDPPAAAHHTNGHNAAATGKVLTHMAELPEPVTTPRGAQ